MKNIVKISAAFLLVFGLSTTSNAQVSDTSPQFGVKGGVNFSNIYNEEVDDNNVLTSFNAGVFAEFPVSEFISIQPELLYSRKGAELVYDNIVSGTAKFKLNYIEAPVLLKFNLGENFNIHAGPYFAYLIDAKVTNESDSGNFDFEENYDNDDFNKFDVGLAAGVGVNFEGFGVGVRYNYGLSTVGKERSVAGQTYTLPDGKNSNLSLYVTLAL